MERFARLLKPGAADNPHGDTPVPTSCTWTIPPGYPPRSRPAHRPEVQIHALGSVETLLRQVLERRNPGEIPSPSFPKESRPLIRNRRDSFGRENQSRTIIAAVIQIFGNRDGRKTGRSEIFDVRLL